MSWVLFSIVTNPEVEAKVLAELEQQGFLASPAQPQPRVLEYDGISKLPNLTAVLNETMRYLTVRPKLVTGMVFMVSIRVSITLFWLWCTETYDDLLIRGFYLLFHFVVINTYS
jgi:hypothetical protein